MSAGQFHLGAWTGPYRAEPIERALQGIASAGIPLVGLYREHTGVPLIPPHSTAAEMTALRARVQSSGLTPMALWASEGAHEREDVLIGDVLTCSTMEIPVVQLFGPWPFATEMRRKPEMQWYGEVEQFLAVLAAAAQEAERNGVTIVIKPHRGATATGADIVDVVARIGSAAVRACWDACNVRYYEGLDPVDDLEHSGVAPLIHTVSIKDHSGPPMNPSFPIAGEGDVDHPRMLRVLAAAGFEGTVLIDRGVGPGVDQLDGAAADAFVARSYQYMRDLVQKQERAA